MEKQIRWLYEELPKWVAEGLVDEPTADRLRVHYGEVAPAKKTWTVIWPILASICMALGVLLLASSQWYDITRETRLSWLVGLTALSLVGVAVVVARPTLPVSVREAVGAFHALMLPGALWLADSMYAVNRFQEWHAVIWAALLLLPTVYLLRSVVAASVYVLLAASFCGADGAAQAWFGKQLVWILLAAAAPYFYLLYRDGSRPKEMLLFGWSYGVAVYSAYFSTLMDLDVVNLAFFVVMATLTMYIGLLPGRAKLWGIPFRWIGGAAFIVGMLLTTMRSTWVDLGRQEPSVWPIVMLMLVLFAAGAVWWRMVQHRSGPLVMIGVFPFLVVIGTVITAFRAGYTLLAVVMMMYYLVATGWMLWDGMRHRSLVRTDIGLVMAGLFILARLADSQFTDYERGVAFLCIGAMILAGHILFRMRLSRQEKGMQRQVQRARQRREEAAIAEERASHMPRADHATPPVTRSVPVMSQRQREMPVMPPVHRADHEEQGGADHEEK